jgi:hypothetical protein
MTRTAPVAQATQAETPQQALELLIADLHDDGPAVTASNVTALANRYCGGQSPEFVAELVDLIHAENHKDGRIRLIPCYQVVRAYRRT